MTCAEGLKIPLSNRQMVSFSVGGGAGLGQAGDMAAGMAVGTLEGRLSNSSLAWEVKKAPTLELPMRGITGEKGHFLPCIASFFHTHTFFIRQAIKAFWREGEGAGEWAHHTCCLPAHCSATMLPAFTGISPHGHPLPVSVRDTRHSL